MDRDQPSFTDVEGGNRRRVSRRERRFLETTNATIPWSTWVGLIEPYYYADKPGKRGRKAKPIETMLRITCYSCGSHCRMRRGGAIPRQPRSGAPSR
jgi:IS5 family transposase